MGEVRGSFNLTRIGCRSRDSGKVVEGNTVSESGIVDLGEVDWFGLLDEVEVGETMSVVSLPMTMVEFSDNVVYFIRLAFVYKVDLLGDGGDVVHNRVCFM